MAYHDKIEHSSRRTLLDTEHSADFLRERDTDLQRSGDRLFLSPQQRTQQRHSAVSRARDVLLHPPVGDTGDREGW